eukprot:1124338-Pelagomonas_calceolata.AAC.8
MVGLALLWLPPLEPSSSFSLSDPLLSSVAPALAPSAFWVLGCKRTRLMPPEPAVAEVDKQ